MSWFSRLPIRRRLMAVIVASCSLALLLACAALAAYELLDFRSAVVRDTTALADIVGANTQAALSFDDPESAKRVLAALQAEPSVLGARVYRSSGAPFAEFVRPGSEPAFAERPPPDGHAFTLRTLGLARPITLEAQRIGTIAIVTSLAGMYERIALFGVISVVVLLGSLLVAAAVSSRLQRPISQPILDLAEVARRVAERKDYAVRAPDQGTAELGVLTGAFNHMLAQIAQHADHLASTNAELQQFAYITSHDLKEPLRMVTMYMSIIERQLGERLTGQQRQYLTYAVEGATRMQTLINDLLAFTRASHSQEADEPVDLQQVLREVQATMQEEINRQHASIRVGELPTVPGTRTKLALVFQNLIGNALKFHRPEAAPRIEVAAERAGDRWLISVADNGIGIDPAYHEQIFGVFQRLHGREEFAGNGMGLAICRKIVEQHGGRISLRSQPGQGSTFVVELPATRPASGSHEAPAVAAAATGDQR